MSAPECDSRSLFSMDHYHISEEIGFILPDPLAKLQAYYQPWMDIALQVPELVDSHELRSRINEMPLLSCHFLQKHRELRLAHLALSVMTMGYTWQEGENDIIKMLPHNLAVPLWEVSQRLGLPPILTYADVALANWRKMDPEGPFDIENLDVLFNLPGGDSARGFFRVFLLVEIAAVPALMNIPTVINGVRCGDTEAVARALEVISQSIQDLTDALRLMHVHVEPSVFYGTLRIYLTGWRDNPCMPKGLIYEGVQTEPMQYAGATAAQTSLLHCFDELLGVKHEGHSGDFLAHMRSYMPPAHRDLIQDISLQPSLKSFVQQQADEQLKQAYHDCLTKVVAFRCQHINIVSRFITIPAARARKLREQNKGQENGRAPAALENMGTAGSNIMTFLKTTRDETKQAFLSETRKDNK